MLNYSILLFTNREADLKLCEQKLASENIPPLGTCDASLIVRKIFPDNNDQDNDQEPS